MGESIRYEAADAASRALAAADPAMARLIAEEGCVEFGPVQGGPFEVLVRGIVGQQLSGAAAGAIYGHLRDRVGLTPEAVAGASEDELRAAGLSWRKASYVRGIAQAVLAGDIDLDGLRELPDAAAVDRLTRLRGVGRWTAHMFLLFALRRPDVLPVDDLGVRAAAGRLLGLGRPATVEELAAAAERWRPYRSAAALYLWRQGRAGFGVCGDGGAAGSAQGTNLSEVQ